MKTIDHSTHQMAGMGQNSTSEMKTKTSSNGMNMPSMMHNMSSHKMMSHTKMQSLADQHSSMSHAGGMKNMSSMSPVAKQHQGYGGMSMSGDMSKSMDHSMSMSSMIEMMVTGKVAISSTTMTTGTKYQNTKATFKTNDPNKPYTIIKMNLFGWMDRYIWFINGLPEYRAHPIIIEAGKRYRLIFTNASMMHHPMHIHGHFFVLRNGNGAYDPLLHTIDVPPGANVVADFDADAVGQWFFHCHHLYHMAAGMARVFQYSTLFYLGKSLEGCEQIKPFPVPKEKNSYLPIPCIDVTLIKHPQGHHAGFFRASYIDIGADPFNNAQRLTIKTLIGPDYDKLELYTEDAEMKNGVVESADVDIFYWHLISQFWAIKGGINYFYRPAQAPYWQPGIGIEGLMYYFINTNLRIYHHSGSTKMDLQLSRDTQITNNFFIRAGIRSILATKTVVHDEVGSGLNQMRYIIRPYYRLIPGVSVFAEYEHEQAHGAFKSILRKENEATSENTLTFGFMLIL